MSPTFLPLIRHVICEAIMSRVFIVSFTNVNFGTGFSLPIDGFVHFITSARLFKERQENEKKALFKRTEQVSYYDHYTDFFLDESLDLAIVKTTIPVSKEEERKVAWSSENITLGQDIFLLGFPYLDKIRYPNLVANKGFPLPMIKKTTLSVIQYPTMLFDGQINSGFSGGPIIYWDYVEKKQKICGIVATDYMKEETDTLPKLGSGKDAGFGVAYDISVVRKIIDNSKTNKNKVDFLRLI